MSVSNIGSNNAPIIMNAGESFDEKTGLPTPSFVYQQESAIIDPKIKLLEAEITEAKESVSSLKTLETHAKAIEDAIRPFRYKHDLDRQVITSDSLKDSVTTSVKSAASIRSIDLNILQKAQKQVMEITGLTSAGADAHFTGDPAVTSVVASGPGGNDSMFTAGSFNINQGPKVASVTLNAGDSLDAIVTKITAACTAVNVGVTASVVEFQTGSYKLVLESDATGVDNSFTVTPGPANTDPIFQNIKRATSAETTKEVRIYADSDNIPFDPTLPPSPPATTGPVEARIISINGVAVPVEYDSALPTEAEFARMATQINAYAAQTGVGASVGGSLGARHIILRRSDGLTGISVNPYAFPGQEFCAPSQLEYIGEATNAIVNVDGVRHESDTNVFTNITDFSNVTVKNTGQGTIDIVQGNSGFETSVRTLVEKYNAARDFIAAEENKVDENGRPASSLALSNELGGPSSGFIKYLETIRRHSNYSVDNINTLKDMGIEEDADKKLKIIEPTFTNVFKDPALAAEIFDFFAGSNAGGGAGATTANETIPDTLAGVSIPSQGTLVEFTSLYLDNGLTPNPNKQGTLTIDGASTYAGSFYSLEVIWFGPGHNTHEYNVSVKYFASDAANIMNVVSVTPNGGNYDLDLHDPVSGLRLFYTTDNEQIGDIDTIYTSFIPSGNTDLQKDGTITITNFGNTPANAQNISDIIINHDIISNAYSATIIMENEAAPIQVTSGTAPPATNNIGFNVVGGSLDGLQFNYDTTNALGWDQSHIFKNTNFSQAGGGGGAGTSISSIDLHEYLLSLNKNIGSKSKAVSDIVLGHVKEKNELNEQVQEKMRKAQLEIMLARMRTVNQSLLNTIAGVATAA